MKSMRFLGIGSVTGSRIVTNSDLEGIIGEGFDKTKTELSFCDWVEQVTGIKERRWTDQETTEDMMTEASKMALENAGRKISDIDLIISATETGSYIIPDPSIEIAKRLGKPEIPGFTFDAACAGFIYGLHLAYPFIVYGIYQNILLVCGESLHTRLNRDPKTMILLSDAAGAVILGIDSEKGIKELPYIGASYSTNIRLIENLPNVFGARDENNSNGYIEMLSGNDVYKNAVRSMVNSSKEAIKRSCFTLEDIQQSGWLNIHQANLRIIKATSDLLGIPESRTMITIVDEGNPSAPSNPRSLHKYVEQGKVKRGDKILITAIGGGYKFGAVVMEF